MTQDDLTGTDLAGFTIVRELGRGGMGVVYLAEQSSPKRNVALKLLSPALSHDERFRERFARESEAAATTEHPNIVPIYAAGEAEGSLYIAMRYVEGTDLRELIVRDGALPAERAVAIISQVASALDTAHARGMVHRDVKPGNILLDANGHAYLTDFGLIKRNEVSTGITQTGQFMGSVDYCAPEQIKGEEVDARTDVYSLGCVLYECLTGQTPFPRDTDVAVMYAHLEDLPAKSSGLVEGVPSRLDGVVERAMAKHPADRFASAGELAAAARDVVASASTAGGGAGPSSSHAKARGLVALIAVVLVGIAATLILLAGGGDEETAAPSVTPPDRTGPSGPSATGAAVLASGNGIVAISPETGEVVFATDVALNNSGEPSLAAGEGGIWIHDTSNVTHVDPGSGAIVATIPLGSGLGNPGTVAVGLRTVWVGNRKQVERVNPATDELLKPTGVSSTESFQRLLVAVGEGSAWTLDGSGVLSRVSEGGKLEASADVTTDGAGLAVGAGSVWVLDNLDGVVIPVDPATLEVGDPIEVPGNAQRIAILDGLVWVLDTSAGTVTSVDPSTGSIGSPIRVGEESTDLAAGGGALWVTDQGGTLWRVDPVTSTTTVSEVGGPLAASVFDEASDLMWVLVVDIR